MQNVSKKIFLTLPKFHKKTTSCSEDTKNCCPGEKGCTLPGGFTRGEGLIGENFQGGKFPGGISLEP